MQTLLFAVRVLTLRFRPFVLIAAALFSGVATAPVAHAEDILCVMRNGVICLRSRSNCPRGERRYIPSGSQGLQGPAGRAGSMGSPGPTGPQGGVGPIGATGPIGLTGAAGPTGATGPAGTSGAAGPQGIAGPAGSTGTAGQNAVTTYGSFFALMPTDNAATLAVGAALPFPQDGPADGIVRSTSSQFTLPSVGDYEVTWQVSVTEPGQLVLAVNGTEIAYTLVGRATGTSLIVGHMIVRTTSVNSLLTVRNPLGNSTALTITPNAGGTNPVSATLVIKYLAPQ